MKNIFFISLFAFAIGIQGCSSIKVDENDPKSVYEDALDDIENDRYLVAIDKLKTVKSKFSYTSYGALAQLKLADVYYLQESFPEAAAAYEAFFELYPKHEQAPYSLYRAGESYFNDIPEITERDLKSAESAVSTFGLFLRRFPKSEWEEKAQEKLQESNDRLAEKELMIAKFYLRREKWDSARGRLEKLLDRFGSSKHADEAKKLLGELGKKS